MYTRAGVDRCSREEVCRVGGPLENERMPSSPPSPVRALVFDFDGLIIDTEGPVYEAWAEIYRKHGQQLSLDFWKTIIGRGANYFDPLPELEQRLGRRLETEAIRAERRLRTLELVEALTILPGVIEWREEARARNVRLGVASSSGRGWVTGHLERLGLANWDCIRCLEDVERPKPAPDLYKAVLDCLGVPPEQAVAVEDSAHGVDAAKTAGLFCVAVPSALTGEHDFSRADLVLASLGDRSFAEVALIAGDRQRR
jgi:HAD superfamily hydrolase (TIGR01509 family)